jgi:hypothetical protein
MSVPRQNTASTASGATMRRTRRTSDMPATFGVTRPEAEATAAERLAEALGTIRDSSPV